jgi:pimeloyl-ACP methyl ester carboxylesterase
MATHINKRAPTLPASLMQILRRDRRLEFAVAASITALAGLIVGLAMPYGPATAAQALFVMVGGLTVGALAGLLLRSRWVVVVAPLAHVIAIEIARRDAIGPTVDLPRLDEPYGLLALILGRGFHALVGLLPMVLGASLGAALANGRPVRRLVSWPHLLLSVLLLVLAVAIARPASTPPILGADGQPLSGSVAELAAIRLGGDDQAILIRGHSVDKPVLLYLSGGPGQSSLPYPRVILEDLTRDFVLVAWDQRGTGKSYAALAPASTLTLDQAVADTIELTNYLRQRFDEDKIYLLGESWGTTLGVLAAQRAPELYYAMIGSGQMVSQRETDRRLYQDVLALAERTGDTILRDKMLAYGEPPYADIPYGYAFVMGYYDALYQPYAPPAAYLERGRRANLGPWGVLGSEYNLVEKLNVLRGLIDMFTVMYPQIQRVDFRQDVTRLDVPLYLLDGQAELSSRRDLALEWFETVDAPVKRMFSFENAAHAVAFEQYQAFHAILLNTILPETYR